MSDIKKIFGRIFKVREVTVVIFLVLIFLLVGAYNHSFLSGKNMMLTLQSSVMYIFLAMGMSFVLLTKEIDVSVGSTLGLAAAVCATFIRQGSSVFTAVIAAILVGALIGLVNGIGVTAFRVSSIIMTLGTMGIVRGLLTIYTGGKWVENLPSYFKDASQASLFGVVNVYVIITAIIVVAVHLVVSKTRGGKSFAAIGDNIDGAMMMGIKIDRMKVLAYVISGVCAAIAGVVYTSQVGFVSDIAGNGLEMTTIAGCVIGGVSMNGGIGSILGASFGAIIMTSINSALVFLKVPAYWNDAISGTLLIAIVISDVLIHNYSKEKIRKQRLLARTNNIGGASDE